MSSFVVSSKFTSENTGMSNDGMLEKVSSNDMSKSSGIGKSSDSSVSGAGVGAWASVCGAGDLSVPSSVVGFSMGFGVYAENSSMFLMARINCGRISSGISFDISGLFSVGSVIGAGSASGAGAGFFACMIFGTGIVISGFFVRIINVVVATYNGTIAKIKMPKTNPGKPRSWACINLCHCAPLKILK